MPARKRNSLFSENLIKGLAYTLGAALITALIGWATGYFNSSEKDAHSPIKTESSTAPAGMKK
jgi:hypothetical protein